MGFLEAVGAAVLILGALFIILIVAAVLIIRAKLKKFVGELGKLAEEGGSDWVTTPARIHLSSRESHLWENEAGAEASAQAFRNAGFSEAGLWVIPEMGDLKIQGFVHEAEGLWGVIYEKAPLGVWIDCVFRGADSSYITVSNATQGGDLDTQPGHEKHYLAGEPAERIIAKAREASAGRPPAPASPANFAASFEKAYADEMDWRNSRGGPTEDEVRRLALRSGMELDADMLRMQQEISRAQAIDGLDIALREKYLSESGMSAVEWEDVRQRVVFIHDRYTPDLLQNKLYEWDCVVSADSDDDDDEDEDEESASIFNTANFQARRDFADYNAKLPAVKQFKKVGEVANPIQADVYVAPRVISYDE